MAVLIECIDLSRACLHDKELKPCFSLICMGIRNTLIELNIPSEKGPLRMESFQLQYN
jgi:hypothetical protein